MNGSVVESDTFNVTSANFFCEKQVTAYNQVTITFQKGITRMKKDARHLKIFNITDGISREFYNDELENCEIIEQIANNNTALNINEASLQLLPSTTAGVMFQRTLPFSIYRNDVLFGKFFINTSTSNTFKTIYSLKVNDYIQMLESQSYLGGYYEATSVSSVIAEILGDIPYTLDAGLGAKTISGYLPILNKREALREIAFIINAVVDTSRSEGIVIKPVATTISREVEPSEIVKIDTTQENIVTQYQLQTKKLTTKNADTDNIYSARLNGQMTIIFDTPKFNLEISGGTILSSNLNYCIIEGTGLTCTLTGKNYQEASTSATKYNPYVVTTDIPKVESYETTLVCDGENALDNLNFVQYKIKSNFLMENTKVGDLITLNGQKCRVMMLNYNIWQQNIYANAELEAYYE